MLTNTWGQNDTGWFVIEHALTGAAGKNATLRLYFGSGTTTYTVNHPNDGIEIDEVEIFASKYLEF
jgi:hypothetical protein